MRLCLAGLASIMFLSGCTSVQLQEQYSGRLQRPDQIVVLDFAVDADEVQLDDGLAAKAFRSSDLEVVDEKRREISKKVARVFAKKLVAEIQKMGLPAVHETDSPVAGAQENLVVRGSFVSIDQGDSVKRVTIGLGAGASEVVIQVEVVDWMPEGERVVDRFRVTAKSAKNPGAAETMGAGAIAGHLLVSTAVTAGVQTASESFGTSVEADTSRAAEHTATMMKKFFIRQGWIDDEN
jgi:hypothetical protein